MEGRLSSFALLWSTKRIISINSILVRILLVARGTVLYCGTCTPSTPHLLIYLFMSMVDRSGWPCSYQGISNSACVIQHGVVSFAPLNLCHPPPIGQVTFFLKEMGNMVEQQIFCISDGLPTSAVWVRPVLGSRMASSNASRLSFMMCSFSFSCVLGHPFQNVAMVFSLVVYFTSGWVDFRYIHI